MPGHVFEALEDAARFLRYQRMNDEIRAITFTRLVDNAYGEEPDMGAVMHLEQFREELSNVFEGKSRAEIEWQQLESLKRMPGVRFIPKAGVGNG